MAIKIVCANMKGGVGKTVTSINLARILSERGFRTLLVDCDPQRNSTIAYRGETENVPTLFDVMVNGYPAEQCVQKTDFSDNSYLIPSSKMLLNAETAIPTSPNMYKLIKRSFKSLESRFDYIIFDAPPLCGLIVGNILYACDYVIIPTELEMFGINGLMDFYSFISEFTEDNEKLRILGFLRVKYKRNQKLTKELESEVLPEVAANMNTIVFDSVIRESVKCKESIALRVPISEYAPNSPVDVDYNNFVDEMLEEISRD